MPLNTETFPGFPGGSNVAIAQHELDDTEARIIQDGLVDRPGETRRRGPVAPVAGLADISRPASGIAVTLDPQGTDRYGVLNGDNSNGYFSVYSDDLQSLTDLAWPHALPTAPKNSEAERYRIVDIKPSLTGGALVGVSSSYNADSPNQGIAFWRGGNEANYTTGTITVARGGTAVTGSGTSWTENAAPGMFLFGQADHGAGYASVYFGVVLQVNSDTSLTLGTASPYAATAKSYTLQSLRGLAPRVTKGRITTATDTTAVTGGSTRFRSQALATGTWDLYRRSDMAWVGKVSTVTSNTSLTLAANAAVAMSDEEYVALRADSDFNIANTASVNKVGFISSTYAERQWYFNNGAEYGKTYRGWFSDTNDPEALDLAEDGDWLEFASTSMVNEAIRGAQAAHNALLVFKENETFGIFGNSPGNFQVRKIEDDGALSGMSVQPWGGGVIWAGRSGIHFYDGVQVENMTARKLGNIWRNSIETFDPSRYRMWSMIVRDHYYVFIEDLDPTLAIVKGNVSTTPTSWGIAIDMNTRAVTWHTNVHARGSATLPASTGRDVWYVVNAEGSTHPALNGAFESGITGWSLSGSATLSHNTSSPLAGNGSLRATATANDTFSGAVVTIPSPRLVKGTPFTVTLKIKGSAGLIGKGCTILLWEVGGAAAATIPTGGSASPILTGATQTITFTGTLTENDRTSLQLFVRGQPGNNWLIGDTLDIDDVVVTSPSYGVVADAADLFDSEGVDEITCIGSTAGPDMFIETKKFNAGDSLRLKRYKQIRIHYLAQGGAIKVDTVLGLNNIGQTLTSNFPASVLTWEQLAVILGNWDDLTDEYPTWADVVEGVYVPKRVKFMKKSQHMSFRLYQESSAVTRMKLGPYGLGYKLQRPGRVN